MIEKAFPQNTPKVVTNQRLLGGHLGDTLSKRRFVNDKVTKWVDLINSLTKIAVQQPQAAYTALTRSVQCEWQYLQRTIEGCGVWFEPIEKVLNDRFLPALFETPTICHNMRRLIALPVKFGGLGIPNPTTTANDAFKTSQNATSHLCEAIKGKIKLHLKDHMKAMQDARQDYKKEKIKQYY